MANIFKAIPEIMNELNAIGKNSKNNTQNFMYRPIDEIVNNLNPLFSKHGVFVAPTVLETERMERETKNSGKLLYSLVKVSYKFYADDGSFVEAVVIGEGMDSSDKASAKAMTSAYKQALLQVFCIPTANVDYAVEPIKQLVDPIMVLTLEKKMKLKGINLAAVLTNCHVNTLEEITVKQYKILMDKFDEYEDEVPANEN